jgi:hypothetical protein
VSRVLALTAWVLLAASLVGLEVRSLASHRRIPGLLETLRGLTGGIVTRSALFVGWMWLGWHIFAR